MNPEPRKAKRKKRRAPRMIDWYRVDATARIQRVLAAAASLVLGGSMLGAVCVAMMRNASGVTFGRGLRYAMFLSPGTPGTTAVDPLHDPSLVVGLGFLAFALVIGGAATAIVGLMRELSQERWLALRTDGLVLADAGRERRVTWKNVEDVRTEGDLLVVTLRSGETWSIAHRFAGTSPTELGKRITQVRQRVLMGLFR